MAGPVDGKHVGAEVLHVLRPVVFSMGALTFSTKSWIPFMSALLTDVASRALLGRMANLTVRQQQEVHRRCFLWSFYLLRSPFFERFTKIPLARLLSILGRLPLFGVFFGTRLPYCVAQCMLTTYVSFLENCLDLALTLQSHYFYTSAS